MFTKKMNTKKINGVEISFSSFGSGEPLVLIGGFGMTKEFWDLQSQTLETRFHGIAFDNRGAGGSTVPSEPFTLADIAADTVALMDALRIDTAHIFGVSMGGHDCSDNVPGLRGPHQKGGIEVKLQSMSINAFTLFGSEESLMDMLAYREILKKKL